MIGSREFNIDSRFVSLIRKHHVFTLATISPEGPWCASCYYVYLASEHMFVFTTDPVTRHGREMQKDQRVAGNIHLETKIVGMIRGIQFTGRAIQLEGELLKKAKRSYLLKFPMAMLMETTLWGIVPETMKLTDNRLGFGKKLYWPGDSSKNK